MKLRNLLKVCFFSLFYLLVVPAMAQSKVVNGKVINASDGIPNSYFYSPNLNPDLHRLSGDINFYII